MSASQKVAERPIRQAPEHNPIEAMLTRFDRAADLLGLDEGTYEILDANDVFVIPDILANAGGVVVSYFEWVQDRIGYFWEEREVNDRLDTTMRKAFRQVFERTQSSKVNMRTAAYMEGINRVAYITKMRGLYP